MKQEDIIIQYLKMMTIALVTIMSEGDEQALIKKATAKIEEIQKLLISENH
jgi:hypothetical protein